MSSDKASIKVVKDKPLTCGLIMPISAIDGCSAEHWLEVKNIVTEAIEAINDVHFTVKLVSDSDDVGIIQKRIVQNIYSSDIIVCDVSGKNPNVMFELGMRLAFDKPTIIIKDDKTDYSFDTSIIEHITYPRDLRFARIVTFKSTLAEKVSATHRAAKNPDHSTFLKSFGQFQVANLTESIIPADKLVLEMLTDLQMEVSRLRRSTPREISRRPRPFLDQEISSKISSALDTYYAEKSVSKIRKQDKDDLYRYIEEKIEAPVYFHSPEEFEEAVDYIHGRYI